ncbi:hypothetical protein BDN72DRAFT_679916 [Pluteus cervinus]|uniref:Uncharacterized protein n=1 Tax=Pluteus cervinus TaxID=181527 RepID=A0ACD3ARS3_9AGAR|nr:hypothetical protein BDN72DRAFT_679916 [Pluteus cervinus]
MALPLRIPIIKKMTIFLPSALLFVVSEANPHPQPSAHYLHLISSRRAHCPCCCCCFVRDVGRGRTRELQKNNSHLMENVNITGRWPQDANHCGRLERHGSRRVMPGFR